MDYAKLLVSALGWGVIIVVASLLSAFPVMLLWNAVVPAIFGLPIINFWQALMLSLLCRSLFAGSSSSSSSKD